MFDPYNFCYDKIRCAERHSRCDVTDQQASHGSRETADSCDARLRHQFRTGTSCLERALDKRLDFVSLVCQQRRQLLHLPGSEQGIQERDKNYHKRHFEEAATWKRADIYATLVSTRLND